MKAWLKDKWLRFKRWIVGILIAIGVISAPFVVAEDNALSWTPPTQYEDGSAIDPADMAGINIYYAGGAIGDPDITDQAAYALLTQVAFDVTTYVDTNRGNALHCYYVTAETSQGIESAPSNFACKTVDFRVPGQPSSLNVD